ncbi:MAG: 23S rRNA (pseudouridine(1915)-N(3))-methyltransferase RlmH [Nanobdellota archaeon]
MKITLVCIGTIKNKQLRSMIELYESRLHYLHVRYAVKEVQAKTIRSQEQAILQATNTPGDKIVFLLDERGPTMTSQEFSKRLQQEEKKAKEIYFIIGPAEGFSREFKEQFNHTISLSPFTFPHEIARLLLTEQLFRSASILQNRPYHKD